MFHMNVQSCREKTDDIRDTVIEENVDIAFLTETWLHEKGDGPVVKALTPSSHLCENFARKNRSGGGICVIFKRSLEKAINLKRQKYQTMEVVSLAFKQDDYNVTVVCVYRPPYSSKNRKTNKDFVDELPTLFSAYQHREVVFCGDFNLHFDNASDSSVSRAVSYIADFNLKQVVNEATHKKGHILDAVVVSENCPVRPTTVRRLDFSDHFAVFFSIIGAQKPVPMKRNVTSRCLKRVNTDVFILDVRDAIMQLKSTHGLLEHRETFNGNVLLIPPCESLTSTNSNDNSSVATSASSTQGVQVMSPDTLTTTTLNTSSVVSLGQSNPIVDAKSPEFCDELVCSLNSALLKVLDSHAPLSTRSVSDRPSAPWRTDEVLDAKRELRRAEEKSRNSILTVHRQIYSQKRAALKKLNNEAKRNYYCSRLEECKTTKQIYGVTDELFPNKNEKKFPKSIPSEDLPKSFGTFFEEKIANIRKSLDENGGPPASFAPFSGTRMFEFRPIQEEDIRDILSTRALKPSSLDPLPLDLFRICLDDLVPIFTIIINYSLNLGSVPAPFKEALVHPLLKKDGLDVDNMKNYRPVSNLSLLSKILERVVLMQLQEHIKSNGLLDIHQSAYKKDHSCETALLYVLNNLLSNADSKKISLLALLDLSAAFDTLDHGIVLQRLETTFGITGTALTWFQSYLSDRSQRVVADGHVSDVFGLQFGVPQGSVLGPVLFTLYTQPLSHVIESHNVDHHKYADDTQLIDAGTVLNIATVSNNLEHCIDDVGKWMETNKLKLNGDKTELLVSGTKYFLGQLDSPPTLSINGATVSGAECVRDLGVYIDPKLSFHDHFSRVCQSANYELRKLSYVRKFITLSATVQLVSSLVLSRIDYCNALFAGLPDTELGRLQNVQNNAARMIFRRSKRHHVTPLLIALHWLPVKYRITYKIATLAFKKFHGGLPSYLSDLLVVKRAGDRETRSSSERRLEPPPWSRNKTTDRRMFSIVAPDVWNGLPRRLRDITSLSAFKSNLKTHLFREAFKDDL
jgi:hypothetical protein